MRLLVDASDRLSETSHTLDSFSYELTYLCIGAHDEQELRRKYVQCVSALDFQTRPRKLPKWGGSHGLLGHL